MARNLETSIKSIERLVYDLRAQVQLQDKKILKTVKQVTKDYLEKYRNVPSDDQSQGVIMSENDEKNGINSDEFDKDSR